MAIIDIRGTHGSGKSHIPLSILNNNHYRPLRGRPLTHDGGETILAYSVVALDLVILGRYETACGGCDGIKTQDEIRARILHFSQLGYKHLMLEGILVAHTFSTWNEYAKGKDWRFVFLDTPLETCIERVNSRRAASGKGPLADPKNIVRDWHRIRSLEPKFKAEGHFTTWAPHHDPVPTVLELL